MPYILFLLAFCFVAVILLQKANKRGMNSSSKNWFKAGGVLGAAMLIARATRTPFATVLTMLPFIIPELRKMEESQTRASGSAMTREEAALILGVGVNSTAEEIRDAHRRLIAKNHPDTGGSEYLAAKINQARDILLG